MRWTTPCLSAVTPRTVIDIPKANVYKFGDTSRSTPVFRDVEWRVAESESWAVIGSGSGEKTTFLKALLGHFRIVPTPPAPGGLFPFLSGREPSSAVSLVSFTHRPRSSGSEFYDYTARYGAVREEDRVTLRESMFPDTAPFVCADLVDETPKRAHHQEIKDARFVELLQKMELMDLLDLPLIALSNGQTRRARVVKALIENPELLILDEPLTGLDVTSRPTLLALLKSLHSTQKPRIIMGLRVQDPIPEWITHLFLVKDGKITAGPKDIVLGELKLSETSETVSSPRVAKPVGEILVDMQNIKLQYHERKVLTDVSWTIRAGERWHLQGQNGSGKTSLLSILTGDHPQSYAQSSSLHLFGRPRAQTPTPHLRSLISQVSPELTNAFPRRAGMSVRDAISTGFDGRFVVGGQEGLGVGWNGVLSDEEVEWRRSRVEHLLVAFEVDGERKFIGLSGGEQSVVLLMRALVGQPPIVLLDEVWSGMDQGMITRVRDYLRKQLTDEQAVVVISHWEEEVPWTAEDGLKTLQLTNGTAHVLG